MFSVFSLTSILINRYRSHNLEISTMPKEANQIIHMCIMRSKSIGGEKTVSGKDKKLLGWLTVRLRWVVYRI